MPCLLAFACSARLTLPQGVQIDCKADGECPEGYLCEPESARCILANDSQPPLVTIGAIDRSMSTVLVPVVVYAEADAPAHLDAWLIADDETSTPVQLDKQAIDAAPKGVASTLGWDAAAAFGSTAQRSGLRLALEATNARGTGPRTTSARFAFGDDAPIARFNEATINRLLGTVQGDVVLEVLLSDTAFDLANVEIEVRAEASSAWEPATISLGATQQLLSSAEGVAHVFVWSSRTQTGGVRRNSDTAGVRVRATDTPLPGVSSVGAWHELTRVHVANQAPPALTAVRARRAELGGGTGPVQITYTLSDEEADRVDLAVDYSLDAGSTWFPALEYPNRYSEGTRELVAAPASVGGIEHLFTWDAGALVLAPQKALVRLRARDDSGEAAAALVALLEAVGPIGGTGALFRPAETVADGNGDPAIATTLGDFNGDDIIDVASLHTAASPGSSVAVAAVLGTSVGTFQAYAGAVAGTGYYGDWAQVIASGDFDGDGKDDVAVSLSKSDLSEQQHLAVMFGGASGFSAPQLVPVAARPKAVAAADFDGDGRSDIVCSAGYVLTFVSFDAARTPTVTADATPSIEAFAMDFGIGDFDEDGRMDLLVPDTWPTTLAVHVLLNRSSPGGLSFAISSLPSDIAANAIVAADVTGDGHMDVAIVHLLSGVLRVLEGDGHGGFALAIDYEAGVGPGRLSAGDVNQDGLTDLLYGAGNAQVHLGRQRRAAGEPTLFGAGSIQLDGVNAQNARVADLDRDGANDIVTGSSSGLRLVRGDARAYFGRASLSAPATTRLPRTGASAALAEDLDGDSVSDLVVCGADAHGAYLFSLRGEARAHVGQGTFTLWQTLPLWAAAYTCVAQLADVNGDGAIDVVASNGDFLRVLRGRGEGSFEDEGHDYPIGAYATGIAAGDLNGDGRDDVIVVSQSDTVSLTKLLASGGATLLAAPESIALCQAYDAAVRDFNADGLADVVVLCLQDLKTLLGNGDGSLSAGPSRSLASSNASGRFAIADIDADGADDLVVSGFVTEYMLFGQKTGGLPNGAFSEGPSLITSARSLPMDSDGDGVLDMLRVSNAAMSIAPASVISGFGTGTFQSAVSVTTLGASSAVALADFDGDDRTDVLTVSSGSGVVSARSGLGQNPRRRGRREASRVLSLAAAGDFSVIESAPMSAPDRFGNLPAPTAFAWTTSTWQVPGSAGWTPLSRQVLFGGDAHLATVNEQGALGVVTSFAQDAAFVITLPLQARDLASASAGEIRLVRGAPDWERDPANLSLLPMLGGRPLVRERVAWTTLPRAPSDDLNMGSGPRFARVGATASLRIYTDRLGAFQAFWR